MQQCGLLLAVRSIVQCLTLYFLIENTALCNVARSLFNSNGLWMFMCESTGKLHLRGTGASWMNTYKENKCVPDDVGVLESAILLASPSSVIVVRGGGRYTMSNVVIDKSVKIEVRDGAHLLRLKKKITHIETHTLVVLYTLLHASNRTVVTNKKRRSSPPRRPPHSFPLLG